MKDVKDMEVFLKKMKAAGLYDDPQFVRMWNAIWEGANIKSPNAKPLKRLRHDMDIASTSIE